MCEISSFVVSLLSAHASEPNTLSENSTRQNDNLTISEVEDALLTGRILEQYEDTGRGESCLVAGFSEIGKPIHIVCGARGDWLLVLTAYIPRLPKFKTPYERGI